MNINDLTIGQAKELASLFGGAQQVTTQRASQDHGLCIVAAERGWVFVGQCSEDADGNVTLKDSRTIIYWGTTNGIEEIANGGPTSKTRLGDVAPLRKIPAKSVVYILQCAASKWS